MKRNWDVVREVLLEAEALDQKRQKENCYQLSEDDDKGSAEHALALFRAGFLEGKEDGDEEGPYLRVKGLTWQGHELLETMRSKPVWESIKSTAREKGVELTFDAVKTLGAMAMKAVLGSD